ncbi:D-glycerate dehydrogenase [Candidatus Sumerlaeota bacterium]|nr:D-glycerate dehydrogenase [Candidatus Sumerlaeota bacterium]
MKIHVTFNFFQSPLKLIRDQEWEISTYAGSYPQPQDALLQAMTDCDGLICTLFDRLDKAFFANLPRDAKHPLRAISQFGVGYDNIDIAAAETAGIIVTNTPGVLTDATAEIAIALMLAAARQISEGERLVRSGEWTVWEPNQMLGTGLTGKTLGIIGAGRIGTATALKARGFNMRTLYAARNPNLILETELGAERVSFAQLLGEADFISVHVPLTPATRHLIGSDQLRLMKPTAILVNTSRGAVIDEAALAAALREGRIAAAGLDVYENEPRLTEGLAKLSNVVLAPHLGSATRETREKMGMLAATNLIAALKGENPPNRVRPPRPYGSPTGNA